MQAALNSSCAALHPGRPAAARACPPSSAASSSLPPTCWPSMKICGTVVRPLARLQHLVRARVVLHDVDVLVLTPLCSSSALGARAIAAEHRGVDLDPVAISATSPPASPNLHSPAPPLRPPAPRSALDAPGARRAEDLAQASTVAPVVRTSSTRRMRQPRPYAAAARRRRRAHCAGGPGAEPPCEGVRRRRSSSR